MNPSGKQAAASRLLYELASAIEEYSLCIRNDDSFEVKKSIRLRLKEIENQILLLRRESDSFFMPHIPGDKTRT